jgi:hypothetical protein
MKKSSILVTACLVVCGLFLTQPAFAALYSGPWQSDGGAIVSIEDTDSIFGFYDYNSENDYHDLTNGANRFSVDVDEDLLTVTSLSDMTIKSFPLTLNDDGIAQFGFYMKVKNGSTITLSIEADTTFNINTGLYELNFGNEATLVLQNAIPSEQNPLPTPVPTAALLLGSGLVGLVGFKRKTAQN